MLFMILYSNDEEPVGILVWHFIPESLQFATERYFSRDICYNLVRYTTEVIETLLLDGV